MKSNAASPPPPAPSNAGSAHAFLRRNGCPWFKADWLNVGFLHGSIEPERLQPHVPFPLDQWEGHAWVSLVAFRMERLRPFVGGRLSACFFKPIASHDFLNVRTYVRVNGRRGIYFLREFVANRLSPWIGPATYGLPYERTASISYAADMQRGGFDGRVGRWWNGGPCELRLCLAWPPGGSFGGAAPDSRDEFLVERYDAFTEWHSLQRRFSIWHEPWPLVEAGFEVEDSGLLHALGEWTDVIRWRSAHFSPGICDIWKSRPCRIRREPRNRRQGGGVAFLEEP